MQKSDYKTDSHNRKLGPHKGRMITVELIEGKRAFVLRSGGPLVLELPMAGGRLTPVALGISFPKGTTRGSYELPIIEQTLDGKILGSFAFEVISR